MQRKMQSGKILQAVTFHEMRQVYYFEPLPNCDTGLWGSLKAHVQVATKVYGLKYIVQKNKTTITILFIKIS